MSDEFDDIIWEDDDGDDVSLLPSIVKEENIKNEFVSLKPTVVEENIYDIARRNSRARFEFYKHLDDLEMHALDVMMQELGASAEIASMSAQFTVGGPIDLNKVVLHAPNAELDRRKRPNVHIRQRSPHCSVQINPGGFVSILGSRSRTELYVASRRMAYLIKRSGGNPTARQNNFLINNIVLSCKTFKERRCEHVEYRLREMGWEANLDKEIFPCVRVVINYPQKHSCKVFRTGAQIFMGLKTVTDCIDSIKYFVQVLDQQKAVETAVQSNYGVFTAKLKSDTPAMLEYEQPTETDIQEEEDFTIDHPNFE